MWKSIIIQFNILFASVFNYFTSRSFFLELSQFKQKKFILSVLMSCLKMCHWKKNLTDRAVIVCCHLSICVQQETDQVFLTNKRLPLSFCLKKKRGSLTWIRLNPHYLNNVLGSAGGCEAKERMLQQKRLLEDL